MSGTFLSWKILQSDVRVRNHNSGTISARNKLKRSPVPVYVKRLTIPLKNRSDLSGNRILTVMFLPTISLGSMEAVSARAPNWYAEQARELFFAAETT